MAEFPALPLWTDAYLADTRHLSTVEHGAYLLLLMTAWRTPECRLPDDDKMLARWAGLDARRWAQMKPTIMQFWLLDGGFWTQKRLSKEAVWVRKNAKANHEKASAGGKAKALKDKQAALLEAQAKHASGVLPTPTPTLIPLDEESNGENSPSLDPTKVMFDAGIRLLGAAGVSEGKARSVIGKWKRDHGDAHVMAAFGQAQRNGAIDPVAFIEGCFRAKRSNPPSRFSPIEDTAPVL